MSKNPVSLWNLRNDILDVEPEDRRVLDLVLIFAGTLGLVGPMASAKFGFGKSLGLLMHAIRASVFDPDNMPLSDSDLTGADIRLVNPLFRRLLDEFGLAERLLKKFPQQQQRSMIVPMSEWSGWWGYFSGQILIPSLVAGERPEAVKPMFEPEPSRLLRLYDELIWASFTDPERRDWVLRFAGTLSLVAPYALSGQLGCDEALDVICHNLGMLVEDPAAAESDPCASIVNKLIRELLLAFGLRELVLDSFPRFQSADSPIIDREFWDEWWGYMQREVLVEQVA